MVASVASWLLCFLSGFLLQGVRPDMTSMTPQVSAPAGVITGSRLTDPDGRTYVAYRGIPYAKPPIGELRFAKPEPAERLDGVFAATKEGPVCPHPTVFSKRLGGRNVSEDCLILNVYTPKVEVDLKSPRKVMVYIHGGGYVVGSSTKFYPGSLVTANDVIMVTLNYRLGVLGFLSTGDKSCPGNFALWDMTLALKWVKDNIRSFGGDPDDVAISGESAGGSAVGYLTISPHTKGLFTKAYPQSGSPTSVFGLSMNPRKDALDLAKTLGCHSGAADDGTTTITQGIISCLRKLPVLDFAQFTGFKIDNAEYVPTVDFDFLPDSPHRLIKDDDYLRDVGFFDRAYLVGINNNEASIMKMYSEFTINMVRQREDMSAEDVEKWLAKYRAGGFTHHVTSRLGGAASSEQVDFAVDWYDRRHGNETLAQLSGDVNFLVPVFDYIEAAARGKNTKIWLFHLNHFPRFMKGEVKGSIHALDLIYYFDLSIQSLEVLLNAGMDWKLGMDQEDFRLKRLFGSFLADFIKTGSVTDSVAAKELGVASWPEFTSRDGKFLDLKPRSEIKAGLGRDVRRMWAELQRRTPSGRSPDHEEL